MLVTKTLEPPTAVLGAWELPPAAAAGAGAGARPPPPRRALLHRLSLVTVAEPGPSGLELAADWALPEPAAAVCPLPGGRLLALAAGGACHALELPPGAPPPTPLGEQPHAHAQAAGAAAAAAAPGSGAGAALFLPPPAPVLESLPPQAPPRRGAAPGTAPREPLPFGPAAASPPLTLRPGGAGGGVGGAGGAAGPSSSGGGGGGGGWERTYVLAARAHGALQLITWAAPAGSGGGGGPGGVLSATTFNATPALLTGGLPGAQQLGRALGGQRPRPGCGRSSCSGHPTPHPLAARPAPNPARPTSRRRRRR
jgi:hypothetical protein